MATFDCLIVGGGVVGLSIAYELARHGQQIAVVDRRKAGKEASWAGAGILPPANRLAAHHPYDELRGLSYELHRQWADRLAEETGIDTGYRTCGGIYLGRTPGEAAALQGMAVQCTVEGIVMDRLDDHQLGSVEPALSGALAAGRFRTAYHLPGEAQLRNPRHLRALISACQARGVTILEDTEVIGWQTDGRNSAAVTTSTGRVVANRFCITAGAWSQRLLESLNAPTGILPIRGQMALLRSPQPELRQIINDGPRYLVPRDDGHLLAGSTEEEVGFDQRTTVEAIEELVRFATELVPSLHSATLVRSWAGLRPASYDGLPYLGPVPDFDNVFAAAGHFRSGIYLSTGTAQVMSQLIRGERPEIDLTPFRLGRQ